MSRHRIRVVTDVEENFWDFTAFKDILGGNRLKFGTSARSGKRFPLKGFDVEDQSCGGAIIADMQSQERNSPDYGEFRALKVEVERQWVAYLNIEEYIEDQVQAFREPGRVGH